MVRFINIDWLQISCSGYSGRWKKQNWIKLDFETRIFRECWEYRVNDKPLLHAQCVPKSKILKSDMVIIKVDNQELYECNPIQLLYDIILDENLQFNNMSRLDICMDFNTFDLNIDTQQFFRNFFDCCFLKNGTNECKSHQTQHSSMVYDYLKFGSNYSAVRAYIYNKTKEMKEVKFKGYIYNTWIKNNIDINKDVYRLEFSINEFNKFLVDKDTGNTINIDLDYLFKSENLIELFTILYNKYFDFRYNNKLANKSRMKKVELFNFEDVRYCYYSDNEYLNSDRMDKVFIKKLNSLNNELRTIKKDMADDLELAKEYIIRKKNLDQWAIDRGFIQDDKIDPTKVKRYNITEQTHLIID